MAWNPKKSVTEVTSDPKRAVTAVATGGLSEINKPVLDQLQRVDPMKKRDTGNNYDIQAAAPLVAPTMDPNARASSVQMTDPRQAVINMAPQDQFRQQQLNLANQLAMQASGQGPSIAEQQLRQGQESNLAATMATLNSQRGAPSAALARNAQQTMAQINAKASQDASIARLQEQMQAAGLLGTVTGQARGQDIGLATSNAEILAANARQDAQLGQQFMELQQRYAAMGLDAAKANQMAALDIEKIRSGQSQFNAQQSAAENARRDAIVGQVLGAGAAAYTGGAPGAASTLVK